MQLFDEDSLHILVLVCYIRIEQKTLNTCQSFLAVNSIIKAFSDCQRIFLQKENENIVSLIRDLIATNDEFLYFTISIKIYKSIVPNISVTSCAKQNDIKYCYVG
uniref:Uncharacterized protein n=1 Tax=Onchocerca volvulus TaxID=6282 RepID=A0A8R1TX71_ONCVO